MTRYWHYTNGRHITDIMVDGVIRPADDGSGASPLVWLSSNPLWENAAARYLKSPVTGGRLLVLNADQMAVFCDGIFRIAVDADAFSLHAWTGDLIERAGISERTVGKHLAGANLTDSDPTQWAGSLKPIPCEFWNGIDCWRDGAWIALTDEDIVPLVERLWKPESATRRGTLPMAATYCRLALNGLAL